MLFERLVALDAEDIDPDAAVERRPDDAWLASLYDDHPDLPRDVVDEMRAQLAVKQKHGEALRDELSALRAHWPDVRAQLRAILVPSARIVEVLARAGAPSSPSAIGVDREAAVHTVRVCRHMRSRYVALDLLDDLGLLDAWATDVVQAVEA
jgi:glycerol-1-phosphate dehydrogenase [NAD(P)+]